MPDAWVFPGGAVDPIDTELARDHLEGTELDAMRICALRELFEETGIWLGEPLDHVESTRLEVLDDPSTFRKLFARCGSQIDRLVWTSRWITPIGVPKRFDTYFFLLEVDDSHDPTPEHREGVEIRWLTPGEALAQHESGEFSMVFPTIRNLEAIAAAGSSTDLIESRRGASIETTQPVLVIENGSKRIFIPGEE